jgi:ribonuclease HI
MVTWCSRCQATTTLRVDAAAYAALPLPAHHVPRVPPDSGATLQGAITSEDFDFFLGTLPLRTMPGPDCLPYELLKSSPQQFKEQILECINAILLKEAVPPASWLGGMIRFLFKKGDLLDAENYRPVCLQDCIYKLLSAILTDRLYRLAERYGLIDSSQEGFRKLHSTQRQVQSLHWAIEEASHKRTKLYVVYIDFANAFNSVDHEALWCWLQEMNVPDVDLLRSLYDHAHYTADLPYGKTASISLTRGTKQGDKLSPLLFDLVFNCLLLALRATGIASRLMTGLRSPARGFADDLVLCTQSAADMNCLMTVVSNFGHWSGMRVKLAKSVASAFDFAQKEELATGEILFEGAPFRHLPADEQFCYLGVRASILARTAGRRRWRPTVSPNLAEEKAHVFSATKELSSVAKHHRYRLGQMVPAMQMVAAARFRYSAALVPWTDAELDQLHKVWLQVHRAAWRLPPGFASAPFVLPEAQAGLTVPHPRVVLIQALTTLIEQLCALPDELRQQTVSRYRRLCDRCGCHNERELAEHLMEQNTPPRCPVARLLRLSGQLGVQVRLPACLSSATRQRELSWHGLLKHLRSAASALGTEDKLADLAALEAAWSTIRRFFWRRGIRHPRMLAANPHAIPVVWLLPTTVSRSSSWLEPLRRSLLSVDTLSLFPRLDRGEQVRAVAAHQALIHEVLGTLRRGGAPILLLFADERWNAVRSSMPWLSWRLALQRHGLPVSEEAWKTGSERARAPILDLLLLGTCPETATDVLLDLLLTVAPYLRSMSVDQEMEDRGPLTWAPVRLLPEAAEFFLTDSTAGSIDLGPYRICTRDGLVRVERGGQHVGTVKQCRFGLLAAAYGKEELCGALPAWIADIEQAETSKGVPSAQFWTQVQSVLHGDCILGCNPLVASSAFTRAYKCLQSQEGWGHAINTAPTCIVYNLLTLSRPEQLYLCRGLTAGGSWYALTRRSALDPQVNQQLNACGTRLHSFRRGSRAAAAKGGWRTGKVSTVQTAEAWTLWASSGVVESRQKRAELIQRLAGLRLTVEGVDPSDPLGREAAYGPSGAVYRNDGIIVATDGSLKDDGSMGAAFVSMGERIPARSVAVFGPASSTRPELTGISLALENCPITENLTILTDSLDSLTSLFNLRRADFPQTLFRHPSRHLLVHLVSLLNNRHAAGALTRLVKVKAHSGDPLNEAADALASAAAEHDDNRWAGGQHLDPDAVHFYMAGHDTPVVWDVRVRRALTQVAALQVAAKLVGPRRRRDGTEVPPPITTAWLMRQDQGRQVLGAALRTMRTDAAKRRVLQTLAGAFPCNALLHRWKLRASGSCDLCACPAETQAHIQCVCPALKRARIAAHHHLAGTIFDFISSAGQGWRVYRELTLAGLQGLPVPEHSMTDWYHMCDELTDGDLETATEAERALASSIRRKRPDGWAIHWGRRKIQILEFTRCNDYRLDWRELTEEYKSERYRLLRDKMAASLPHGWTVETVCLTIGIRGSYAESQWSASLSALGISPAGVSSLMATLVSVCLAELNELYSVRSTALRLRADAQ